MTFSVTSEPHVEAETVSAQADAEIPSWWGPLAKAAGNRSIFLAPEWIQTWMESYGAEFEAQWVCWRHENEVVAGCLLLSRTTWTLGGTLPTRSLFLNATGETSHRSPMSEYNDILCLPGYEQSVSRDAVALLNRQSWARLHLLGYREGALLGILDSKVASAGKEMKTQTAYFADLVAMAGKEFESTLAGKVGSHIRRNRRLYEKDYGAFQVWRANNLDDALDYFDQLTMLHGARWKARGQEGSFSSPAVVAFHRRLIKRLWDGGNVDLLCIRNDQAAVGYLYNFVSEGKVYVFQTGFRYEQDSKLSPGLLTHSLAIEYYRRLGLFEYDLLAGEALYKRSLAKGERALHWTVVYRDRPWPRLLLRAKQLKARLQQSRDAI